MKTLIELYDPRPFENIISTEMFRPERTVFLCPPSEAFNASVKKQLERYLRHRSIETGLVFVPASLLDTAEVIETLRKIIRTYPDCAMDISGGSDAVLFAAGAVAAETKIPVFTYSRRKNTFFNIQNAPFADALPCALELNVSDCFLMAGATTMTGRVDNGILENYAALIPEMFALYLKHRKDWVNIVAFMQRISQSGEGETPVLSVSGAYSQKAERNRYIAAPEKALNDMERIGLISALKIRPKESVSFTFRDAEIRAWLRDVGSILELYTYQCCKDTGLYRDVHTSVVVDWDGGAEKRVVTNEIDVMAVSGLVPVFISCKTCAVKTEALNELAILKDRFGSEMAKAAIVTAERGGSAMRSRAQKLGIYVIDLEDLKKGNLKSCLRSLIEENPKG